MKKHTDKAPSKKTLKTGLLFIAVQIVLIVLLVTTLTQRQQVSKENTETVSFIVDKVEVIDLISFDNHSHKKIYLYNDTVRYRYELRENVKNLESTLTNKRITVIYEKKTNIAVDIRGENDVFYTIDDYNAEQKTQLLVGIIGISVIELLFLVVLGFYLLFFCDLKKVLIKRKHKQ